MNAVLFNKVAEGQEFLKSFRENLKKFNRKVRILVVEDSESDRELLMRAISKYGPGVDVTCVKSGVQAIDELQRSQYDLLFLDIKLNGFSGLDLLRELLNLAIKVSVVVLSGHFERDSREMQEAWKLGAILACPKPLGQKQIELILGTP